jgi:2-polyprenyl-3-methyl-5-hydroxy-6-metoxy-1,4-benzoquinol methylase
MTFAERGKTEMDLYERPCPVCGGTDCVLFAGEKIERAKITKLTYASRKEPEFMRLRLVRCRRCDLVYAPSVPDVSFLGTAYEEAAYDSDEEARYAASSYAGALAPHVARIQNKQDAVDVGAGNGALLPWLKAQGFVRVAGVEPSQTAIDAAPEDIRPLLRKGLFDRKLIADLHPSLMCSFMTLEHMPNPGDFAKAAHDALDTGGVLAIVVHNYQGLLNRILGLRSPIMDIEHLQLFCPKAIEALLRNAGFGEITIQPLKNEYPLRYWLRLTPLPAAAKKWIARSFEILNITRVTLSCRVGNLLATGRK